MERKKDMDSLISEIIAARYKHPGGNTTDYLPDKREVTKIIELLRQLVFPGYFENRGAGAADAGDDTCGLISEVECRLRCQICRAFNTEASVSGNCADRYDVSGEICNRFLRQLPKLIEILFSDVQAAYDGDPAAHSTHEIIFAYPGIFAISVYRFAHELYLLAVPLIPRMMTEYAHSQTGIDIHPGADIGHHFFIDHGTGVVIGETTKIGAHVKLYQGVTLGALSTRGGQDLRGKKRHPTLEDEVTIYSGASILGGETVIGRRCVIGGNVFITNSVPPDIMVSVTNPEIEYRVLKK